MTSPRQEPPRLRKEYLVLLALVILLTWLFTSWCGPTLKRWLGADTSLITPHNNTTIAQETEKKDNKKAGSSKTIHARNVHH